MLFKIPELLEAITDVMTLNYSDMILSISTLRICVDSAAGTPKGVGQVVSGDVMKASCFVEDELVESFEVSAVNRVNSDGTPW
jgi:acylpyruvate hydrolase